MKVRAHSFKCIFGLLEAVHWKTGFCALACHSRGCRNLTQPPPSKTWPWILKSRGLLVTRKNKLTLQLLTFTYAVEGLC